MSVHAATVGYLQDSCDMTAWYSGPCACGRAYKECYAERSLNGLAGERSRFNELANPQSNPKPEPDDG